MHDNGQVCIVHNLSYNSPTLEKRNKNAMVVYLHECTTWAWGRATGLIETVYMYVILSGGHSRHRHGVW